MNKDKPSQEPLVNEIEVDEESNEAEKFEPLENKLDEAIQEDKKDEALDKEYENKRLAEWESKSPEEKRKTIEEKKSYFEENLENGLRKDAESIDGLEVPESIIQEINKLQEYQEKLREVNRTLTEEREDVLKGIDCQLDGNVDISNLDLGDQNEFGEILRSFKNVTQNTLDIEKIDYYLTEDYSSTKEGIEKGLLKTHEDRLIAMEKLEYILRQIEEFEKCLEKMGDTEAAKEDLERMVARMIEIANENPSLFEKLKDAGIVAGIIMLALAVGAAGVTTLIGLLKGTAGAITTIASKKITLVAVGTLGIGANAGTIAGALVGGGILLKAISLLKDEKFRDDLAKSLCGVGGFPGWYKAFGGKEAGASDNK